MGVASKLEDEIERRLANEANVTLPRARPFDLTAFLDPPQVKLAKVAWPDPKLVKGSDCLNRRWSG